MVNFTKPTMLGAITLALTIPFSSISTEALSAQRGLASWYGPGFLGTAHGKRRALQSARHDGCTSHLALRHPCRGHQRADRPLRHRTHQRSRSLRPWTRHRFVEGLGRGSRHRRLGARFARAARAVRSELSRYTRVRAARAYPLPLRERVAGGAGRERGEVDACCVCVVARTRNALRRRRNLDDVPLFTPLPPLAKREGHPLPQGERVSRTAALAATASARIAATRTCWAPRRALSAASRPGRSSRPLGLHAGRRFCPCRHFAARCPPTPCWR